MSNLIEKLFTDITVPLEGATVQVWHPAVTGTSTLYFGYDSTGTKVYALSIDTLYYGDSTKPTEPTYFTKTTQQTDGSSLVETIQISGSETSTTTTPGYYSYDTNPDAVTHIYDPNLGWNASGRSAASFLGDGYCSFSAPSTVTGVVAGLNNLENSAGSGYIEIAYGWFLMGGYARICENGSLPTNNYPILYSSTDVFTVTRTSGVIRYAINGIVYWAAASSQVTPSTAELVMDVSLYAGGDSVVNASITGGTGTTSIDTGSANLTATSTLTGRPKASADLVATSTMTFTGAYSIDTADYRGAALTAASTMAVTKEFAGADLTATSTMTATGHHVTEIHGVFGAMTVLATEGYAAYASINASFAPMTAQVGSEELTTGFDYIAGAFAPMTAGVHSLIGQTNQSSTMSLSPMTATAADHAYAAISGSFQSMQAIAGALPVYNNTIDISFIDSSLSGTMHAEQQNSIEFGFIDTSISILTGANITGDFLSTTLSSTGTLIETMAADISFIESTLSASVTVDGNISASLGFIESTITALGGAESAFGFPAFGFAATATVPDSINVAFGFLDTSISATGTLEQRMSITGGFIDTYLAYCDIAISAPLFSMSASVSTAVSNAVAFVLNVHTGESTTYSNYAFKHIINIGGLAYGVKSDGLYLLRGNDDGGTAINGTVTTKETDFGSFNSKRLDYIYLNSDTTTTLTPYVDGVQKTSHATIQGGRKAKMSLANTGRYWRIKIEGIKKIEGLELLPAKQQRRVK